MKIFVMIPYKEPFETIYREIIKPAIERAGLESSLVKEETFAGSIPEKIHELVDDSSICIADLTEFNPNVMYEVGIALTLKKPVVFITQGDLRSIPFDIRHHRVIKYQLGTEDQGQLYDDLIKTIKATIEYGDSPTELIRQILVPSTLGNTDGLYVVAASPLSYREAFRSRGGWKDRPLGTYSDHIGIRGLMQSFGSIFGLNRLPELLDPDDFDNKALNVPSHLYCIASPKANRLSGMIMDLFFEKNEPRWEFKPDPESRDLRNPKLLIRLKGVPYRPVNSMDSNIMVWDFGVVIRGPHPLDPNYMFMVMAGRSARGTEASCLAVTDPACIQKLNRALKENNMNIDNHKDSFCSVVSICAKDKNYRLGPDNATFRVEDLIKYV